MIEGLYMAEKKQESFTVTDRRLFTSEGELRKDVGEETPQPAPEAPASAKTTAGAGDSRKIPEVGQNMPPMPTASEQQEQADAYHKSSKDLDSRVELSGHS